MNILLDTHALLWFVREDAQLSQTAKDTSTDPNNRKLVSSASGWEIAINVGTNPDCERDLAFDAYSIKRIW